MEQSVEIYHLHRHFTSTLHSSILMAGNYQYISEKGRYYPSYRAAYRVKLKLLRLQMFQEATTAPLYCDDGHIRDADIVPTLPKNRCLV